MVTACYKLLISLIIIDVFELHYLCEAGYSRKVPKWHLKMAQSQGPNTCAVEEIPGTNKKFWTECKYWMHRQICDEKTVIRYECCEGFDRVHGQKGCTAVKPLLDVLETAESLGATIFVQYVRNSGLTERLQREGVFTLLAPHNSAFERMTDSQREEFTQSSNNMWSKILLNHFAEGRIHSKHLHNDHMALTLDDGAKLRMNKYSNGMMTVNCVPVIRKDQEATNGIVHLVADILETVVPGSLVEVLTKDGRFQHFVSLLKESKVEKELEIGGPYTIFAPSDEAFHEYPASRLKKLSSDNYANQAFVRAHIIAHALCPTAVIGDQKLRNLNGKRLDVTCNRTSVYVEGARLTEGVIHSDNSVIHPIGNLLIPNQAKSVLELTTASPETTIFLEMVNKAGAEFALDGIGNLTVLAPTDDAFRALPQEELSRLRDNVGEARDLVMYHVLNGRYPTDSIRDDQKARCVDGHNEIRFRVYRKVPGNKGYGVEASMIKSPDLEGHNGVVHMIDKVLKPPSKNIEDVLKNDGNFSIMLEALRKVKSVEPELLSVEARKGHRSFTLFAPSDEAFRKLGKFELQKVMMDTDYLTQVVKNHLVNHMIPSCAFKSQLHYMVQTKLDVLEVHTQHHQIEIGGAHVFKPDLVTTDGIVHYVDKVILPERLKTGCHSACDNERLQLAKP